MGEELGIEPGPDLRGLQEAILRQEPQLDRPQPPRPAPPAPPSDRRRRRARLAVLGGAALVGVGAALMLAGGGGGEHPATVELPSDSLVALDSATGAFESAVEVGGSPSAVAVGPSGVWVVNAHDRTVSKVDPVRRTEVETVGIGTAGTDVALTRGGVWVSSLEPPAVV